MRSIVPRLFHLSEKMVRWCIERTRWRSPEGLRSEKTVSSEVTLDERHATHVQMRAIPSSLPVASSDPEGCEREGESASRRQSPSRSVETHIPSDRRYVRPTLRRRVFADDVVLDEQSLALPLLPRLWAIPDATGRIASSGRQQRRHLGIPRAGLDFLRVGKGGSMSDQGMGKRERKTNRHGVASQPRNLSIVGAELQHVRHVHFDRLGDCFVCPPRTRQTLRLLLLDLGQLGLLLLLLRALR